MKRRWLSIILSIASICMLLQITVIPAGALVNTNSINPFKRLNGIWYYYKPGKYWNHGSGNNDPASVTTTPCSHHGSGCDYYGNCECNSYEGSIQCHGFAKYIASLIYGSGPDVKTNGTYSNYQKIGDWLIYTNPSSVTLKVGDVIRSKDHTAIVYQVRNGNVTVVEVLSASPKYNCMIRWDGFNGIKKEDCSHETLIKDLKYVCHYAGPAIYLGDVNQDKEFDARDSLAMQQYLNGNTSIITGRGRAAADVNHNGFITIDDLNDMKRALAGAATLTGVGTIDDILEQLDVTALDPSSDLNFISNDSTDFYAPLS